MSDVKLDHDLGRKFQASAFKRKRKAELEQKNLELSGSHDNASVRNKDLGENENGD
jgi:hypothetical protein